MDFELPGSDDPRRAEVRRWLADHPQPTGRELAEAGYVAPHWPRPWGLDADPIAQLIVDDELREAGVRRPLNPIGIGWAGPTLVHAGTPAQRARHLLPLLSGEEIWCQLFSEPGAGSDLAGLSTRAVRDGDEWVVDGQKVWTSLAQVARFGILIARTDPDVAKHRGITYFICPMDAPGVEIRPVVDMTGGHTFNEVFLTGVRLPASSVVGEVGRGWDLAKVTLANERVSLSSGGALWGMGPSAGDLLDVVRGAGRVHDAHLRQRLAALWIEAEILRLIRLRTVSARIRGEQPGPEASVRKVLADEHGQRIMALAKDLAGTGGMLTDVGPLGTPAEGWHSGFCFAPALTVGGGTGEVQRNIIAERVLGLPHDVDVEAGRSWSASRRRGPDG
ncbi:MAG: acyl-CoA dehydrogenase family protein [Actinobacteria bacterium]|nr:acyl-CoA dehydrogenase family protein [Actinomycetota bacterium]